MSPACSKFIGHWSAGTIPAMLIFVFLWTAWAHPEKTFVVKLRDVNELWNEMKL